MKDIELTNGNSLEELKEIPDKVVLAVSLSDKVLLNIPEIMLYTGFGETAVRKMLNHPKCKFVVRNGKKLYANRKLLDRYIDSISGV